MPLNENGWKDYKEMVLHELKRQATDHDKCSGDVWKEVREIKIQLAVQQVKSGLIGLIGGAISVAIGFLVWILKTNLS